MIVTNRGMLACTDVSAADYVSTRRSHVATLRGATLVSSRLDVSDDRPAENHAPCLDIDHRAALTTAADGAVTLWVDGLGHTDWLWAVEAFEGAALSDVDRRDPVAGPGTLTKRLELLAAEPAAVNGALVRDLARVVGPDFDGTYAQMMGAVLESATTGHPCGAPVAEVPRMADPWPLRLTGPALLLPSTSNHHLYVEQPMPWVDYERFLLSLLSTRLVEPGYISASLERQATHLRLPWVLKHDRTPVPA